MIPPFNTADRGLAKASGPRKLLLRETRCHASDAELGSEAPSEIQGPGSSHGARVSVQVLH